MSEEECKDFKKEIIRKRRNKTSKKYGKSPEEKIYTLTKHLNEGKRIDSFEYAEKVISEKEIGDSILYLNHDNKGKYFPEVKVINEKGILEIEDYHYDLFLNENRTKFLYRKCPPPTFKIEIKIDRLNLNRLYNF